MGSSNGAPRLRRILIADDEHLVVEGLTRSLSDLNYTVTASCKNGEEAVQACRNDRPDLVLLDIQMPKMNGLEAAKVIYGEMGIPVVIVSAFSDSQYLRTGADVGVFGYLLKPVTRDDLEAAMTIAWARFLESRTAKDEIAQLSKRLEDRKIIERAKWILVERLQINEETAMKRLQKQARDNRRTLADVASSILENAELFVSGAQTSP
ncbi:MAG: response regulator [Phycisphaerales bacterium]|nr:response regulator [Phycisphaerales bacterium]